MNRADIARKAAEATMSDNERAAWLAAAAAWDTLQVPKPRLSERGKQLAALYAMSRMLATVPTDAPEEPPTTSPKSPGPEPIKPTPTGAFAAIEF